MGDASSTQLLPEAPVGRIPSCDCARRKARPLNRQRVRATAARISPLRVTMVAESAGAGG
ncbi:hypothetical protein JAAARDRAFT_34418 [Jaapia argillacea MUCL 33604]|uniref:Uncharacterized protein n=1 Tax=Jaapia argillacea MUCL 33604 TaxID=933084 RepID=A0A067Q7K8_9AGAM|nr:hypothetical protein JAAARDRAFT_34418 [Jaapia argillacea MUCL 33604]